MDFSFLTPDATSTSATAEEAWRLDRRVGRQRGKSTQSSSQNLRAKLTGNSQTSPEELRVSAPHPIHNDNETDNEDNDSKSFPFLDLPAELRQKILVEAAGVCKMGSMTASAMARLPEDPVAKLKALKETGILSGDEKKFYAKLRLLFCVCSTIREDMMYVEREWLKNRWMDLAELEHLLGLENRPEMDSITLSINCESFLRSPPPGYEKLAYYRRWMAAIRRLPMNHFKTIEVYDAEVPVENGLLMYTFVEQLHFYLLYKTRSRKRGSVVFVVKHLPEHEKDSSTVIQAGEEFQSGRYWRLRET
ncbi:uncharacterized protein IWZ02DRAFT_491662 [Phyllosticta citriasiana]|uniref:uncharacterized protein n=1 Tax=Phyllosticta citriasiana TaxID=595635 RepID=UPI0030FD5EE1